MSVCTVPPGRNRHGRAKSGTSTCRRDARSLSRLYASTLLMDRWMDGLRERGGGLRRRATPTDKQHACMHVCVVLVVLRWSRSLGSDLPPVIIRSIDRPPAAGVSGGCSLLRRERGRGGGGARCTRIFSGWKSFRHKSSEQEA